MDLVDCDDVSEQAILLELQKRFQKNEIYSSIGPILIAINPFKLIGELYSNDVRSAFASKALQSGQVLLGADNHRPHVWMVAKAAYAQLVQTRSPQAIVISGESGGNTHIIYAESC
jgi:myosin-5